MSRRESLVGQDPNLGQASEHKNGIDDGLLMKTAICRRDSLSESGDNPKLQTVVRKGSIENSGELKESVYDTAVNYSLSQTQQQANPPSI